MGRVLVVACAALAREPARHVADPGAYFDNNVGGTVQLLRGMEKAGVRRLVFSSTAAVYGAPDALPISETAA